MNATSEEIATEDVASDKSADKTSMRRRCIRVLRRLLRGVAIFVGVYLLVALIGLIPVNNGFEPTDGGIEIFLVSNPVHADVVVPVTSDVINWRDHFPDECFAGDVDWATHVAIGWGDKGFFIQTPTWADLRASTAAYALFWPSSSCMHVSFKSERSLGESARSVTISAEQYQLLVDYILASFQEAEDGSKIQVGEKGYGSYDAFFEANGAYHCLNTCNSWVGRAVRTAGIRAGWMTPLPKTVFLYLPE